MAVAGYFLLLCALLNVASVFFVGVSDGAASFLLPAVLFVALFAGLARGMFWVAWLALFVVLFSLTTTTAELSAPSRLPGWLLWTTLIVQAAAALKLFGVIWTGRSPRAGDS